jgi:hypothetical protein
MSKVTPRGPANAPAGTREPWFSGLDRALESLVSELNQRCGGSDNPPSCERPADAPCNPASGHPGRATQASDTGQESPWGEIDTAPRDGTPVLVVEPGQDAPVIAVFDDSTRLWQVAYGGDLLAGPTHWLPIPAFRHCPVKSVTAPGALRGEHKRSAAAR